MEINRAGFVSIILPVTDLAKTLKQVHLLSVSPPRYIFFCLLGHHGMSTSRHQLRGDIEKIPTLSREKKVRQWNINKGGVFPACLGVKTYATDMVRDTCWNIHTGTNSPHTQNTHIDLMRVWTALGGRILQVAALSSSHGWICLCLRSYRPEREVCVPRHTLTHAF